MLLLLLRLGIGIVPGSNAPPVVIPPSTGDVELREDGGYELREDGGKELRG